MMKYEIEVTDTFGGEANYCWVRRAEIEVDDDISDLMLVRRAKAAVGYTGVKCRREEWGDRVVLRPIGLLQIMFIMPCY